MSPGRKRSHIDPERAALTRRLTIPMPFIHEEDLEDARWDALPAFVEPNSPLWLRRIAETQARCFARSTPFDGMPYSADHPCEQVVALLPAHGYYVADGTHYAGAVGVWPPGDEWDPRPRVLWMWVHPFCRGRHLVETHWPVLLDRWSGWLHVPGPFTPAGEVLAQRLTELTAGSGGTA